MEHAQKAPVGHITRVTYIDLGKQIKTVVQCDEQMRAFADLNGNRYPDRCNDLEPYDWLTHCFLFDKDELCRAGRFSVDLQPCDAVGVCREPARVTVVELCYAPEELLSESQVIASMGRGLTLESATRTEVCEGAEYVKEVYRTAKGEPVVAYLFFYDTHALRFLTGTPNGTLEGRGHKQTVYEEAMYECGQGHEVVAAFNADFFAIFGDLSPSGLCVKEGTIVANLDSARFFFGEQKDGTPVIDTLKGQPAFAETLQNAVAGRELLLKDGEVCEVAVGEPFGYTPHPRTAVGLCADGRVVIAAVDGRRPAHSNGADLYELAQLLKNHGALRALNLDGGGSSTFLLQNEEGALEMRNHPADLFFPDEDLIREVFNSILIVKRSF